MRLTSLAARPLPSVAVCLAAASAPFSLLSAAASASQVTAPAAARARLFDHMAEAEWTVPPAESSDAEERRWAFDFDATRPDALWFARLEGRALAWSDTGATIEASGGREGGALRLGPGVAEDLSRASLLFPARGRGRWRVSARVQLTGNPERDDASSRETLRVVELRGEVTDPTVPRLRRQTAERVSRRVDPSGWDHLEVEFVTGADTGTVEVQLLHRSGGSAEALTRFDDLVVTELPLNEAQLLSTLARRYRARDGQERETPWRWRVELQGEVRDAALVRAAGALSLPLSVPALALAPRLRFHLGALPETARERGDGSRVTVLFVDAAGEVPLGERVLDAKNDRTARGWSQVNLDLSPVAGRTGRLMFRVTDVDDTPDEPRRAAHRDAARRADASERGAGGRVQRLTDRRGHAARGPHVRVRV